MKSTGLSIKEKLIEKYLDVDTTKKLPKSTDINVLLNRVKTNQKYESRKKLFLMNFTSSLLYFFKIHFLSVTEKKFIFYEYLLF